MLSKPSLKPSKPESGAARRVLIETRFCGNQLGDSWYPDFVSKVYGETDSRFAVKRHWWSRIEWLPKNGTFTRAALARARGERG